MLAKRLGPGLLSGLGKRFSGVNAFVRQGCHILTPSAVTGFDEGKWSADPKGDIRVPASSRTASGWSAGLIHSVGLLRNMDVVTHSIDCESSCSDMKIDADNLQSCLQDARDCKWWQERFDDDVSGDETEFASFFMQLMELSGVNRKNGFRFRGPPGSNSNVIGKLSVLNGQSCIGLFSDFLLHIISNYHTPGVIELDHQSIMMRRAPELVMVGDRMLFSCDIKCDPCQASSAHESVRKMGQVLLYNTFLAYLLNLYAPTSGYTPHEVLSQVKIPGLLLEANKVTLVETTYTSEWLDALVKNKFSHLKPHHFPCTTLYCQEFDITQDKSPLAGKFQGFDCTDEKTLVHVAQLIYAKIVKAKDDGLFSTFLEVMPTRHQLVSRQDADFLSRNNFLVS